MVAKITEKVVICSKEMKKSPSVIAVGDFCPVLL